MHGKDNNTDIIKNSSALTRRDITSVAAQAQQQLNPSASSSICSFEHEPVPSSQPQHEQREIFTTKKHKSPYNQTTTKAASIISNRPRQYTIFVYKTI